MGAGQANAEIMANSLAECKAAKLDAATERHAWRHLGAVDVNGNLRSKASIGIDVEKFVEVHPY
ncbi:hypothetical protein WK29_06520 [Burkholderia vietnamiensis]|nr:hypothetical protein WK29_06520 [Burkholderia vietnamiensis]